MTQLLLSLLLFASPTLKTPDPTERPPSPAPGNLRIPPMAYDEKSAILVWEKPAGAIRHKEVHYLNDGGSPARPVTTANPPYTRIIDYAVYQNGKKIGTANTNNDAHSPAKPYIDAFYEADQANFHTRIQIHNFTITGLKPNTKYTFTVRAVDQEGKESADSAPLIFKTPPAPKVVNIADHGAKGDGKTVNTKAIQAAIAACPKHGKLLVPKGVWKTGALFLKSDMTFEIAEGATLLGSDNPADYPLSKGYRLYPYSKHDRPPSLINLLAPEQHAPSAFENVRIVGKGTIDGNGWKHAAKPSVIDELGRERPVYVASTNLNVQDDGILAKAQFGKGVADGLDPKLAYGQRQSSLLLARGARNLYIGDLTVVNPAFHGIMVLESDHVTVAEVTHQTYDANNADGVEFGNSRNGMVFNNFFDTGDDGVNFAAGTGSEAAKQSPQQTTWIFNNYFRQGHGAVVVGSHTGAWIQSILAEDNVAVGTDVGLRCKSTVDHGGGGRDIVFRDNAMKDLAKQAFIFTLEYQDENAARDYAAAKAPAKFHDITVRNVTVEGVRGKAGAIVVKGDKERQAFHEKLTFDHVQFRNTPPASLSDLKDSLFRDVTFEKVVGGAKPIRIENTEGVRFEGTTPKP